MSGSKTRRALAGVQGASYLYFGLWALLGRSDYRRVHRLRGAPWLLTAHGVWLTLVGTTLGQAAVADRANQPEVRLLGLGAALGLAATDGLTAATSTVAPIYYADLAYEASLAGGWVLARRRAAADR